jgi:hypothetical protein
MACSRRVCLVAMHARKRIDIASQKKAKLD